VPIGLYVIEFLLERSCVSTVCLVYVSV
jgi:hypothetical protein